MRVWNYDRSNLWVNKKCGTPTHTHTQFLEIKNLMIKQNL